MPGLQCFKLQSTIKCQSSLVETGSGSGFSLPRANVKLLLLWGHPSHSIVLTPCSLPLSHTQKTTASCRHLPSAGQPINSKACRRSATVFASPARNRLESRAKNQRQNTMGKIFIGIIAAVASLVLGKALGFFFCLFFLIVIVEEKMTIFFCSRFEFLAMKERLQRRVTEQIWHSCICLELWF